MAFLRKNYGEEGRKVFRELEKTNIRIGIIPVKTNFLKDCKRLGITPPFARIGRKFPLEFRKDIDNFHRRIVISAIRLNYRVLRTLDKQRDDLQFRLRGIASRSNYFHLLEVIKNRVDKERQICAARLKKKLNWLHQKQNKNVCSKLSKSRPTLGISQGSSKCIKKIVYNLSERNLTTVEEQVLEKGLKFSVCSSRLPEIEIKTAVEDFGRKVVNTKQRMSKKQSSETTGQAVEPRDKPGFQCKPKNWWSFPICEDSNLNSCLKRFGQDVQMILRTHKVKPNISRKEMSAMKSLRNDKNIQIVPADKGNATVVLSRHDYDKKMLDILSDSTHFKNLGLKNSTRANASALDKFLKVTFKKGYIEEKLYQYLLPSDPRTPQLYGLVKIHKPEKGYPCRPIMSAVGSYNHNLGRFLVFIITPYLSSHDSFIKDGREFSEKIRNVPSKGNHQVSFDVESLYTMVPVKEAIDVALEVITSDQDPPHMYFMPGEVWYTLFEFCTTKCNFQFRGVNYIQIEGLAMGNPLAPPLANLFMIKVEKKALAAGLFTPVIWWRFVDDIFCVLSKDDFERSDDILLGLNSLHPCIKFTCEKELERKLPFLQVECTANIIGGFDTSVYRKPTHTNLYVRWDSAHPPTQKVGIFSTLLHQARSISSTHMAYQKEKVHLIDTFLELGYPIDLLKKAVLKFENSQPRYVGGDKKASDDRYDHTVLSIPYVPGVSEPISRAWKRCARLLDTSIPTTVVFRPIRKLRSFLSKLYEKEPEGRGVYKATCGHCEASYVGETSLFLSSRRNSHKYNGAICSHAKKTGHNFDAFEWQMLYKEPDINRRKIAEAFLIKAHNPTLNGTKGVYPYVFIE